MLAARALGASVSLRSESSRSDSLIATEVSHLLRRHFVCRGASPLRYSFVAMRVNNAPHMATDSPASAHIP